MVLSGEEPSNLWQLSTMFRLSTTWWAADFLLYAIFVVSKSKFRNYACIWIKRNGNNDLECKMEDQSTGTSHWNKRSLISKRIENYKQNQRIYISQWETIQTSGKSQINLTMTLHQALLHKHIPDEPARSQTDNLCSTFLFQGFLVDGSFFKGRSRLN